jgi:hypothetical protein
VIASLAANASRLSLFASASGAAAGVTHSNVGNSASLTFSVVYDV